MNADLKPYPGYKDSGVRWLGELPKGWNTAPGRAVFDEIVDRDHPEEQLLSVTIGAGVVRQAELLEGTSAKDGSNIDKSSYKRVEPGDLAYNKMRAWQGAVGVSRDTGIVSPAYIVMRSRGSIDSAYAHRLLRIPAFATEAERWSYGITSDQWSLRSKDFKQIHFPIPSPAEQAAIVRFLDHVDTRIQRLITAKERLIGLLEEEKQAIIHRAVTRGLDPDIRLKPSGVDWLGEIPEHWDLVPLKRLASFRSGAGFPVTDQGSRSGELPFAKVSDMNSAGNERWIEDAANRVSRDVAARLGAHVFSPGTLVFPKVGGALLTNKRRVLRHPSCIDNNIMGCTLRVGPNPDFMLTLLELLDLGLFVKPGPVPAIGEGDVREIRVAVPPRAEQKRIARFVLKSTQVPTAAAGTARRQISLLREYRTRLISDVVTGNLDIRQAVASLSDDPDADDSPADEVLEEVTA